MSSKSKATGVLVRGKCGHQHRAEGHARMKAETGATHLQGTPRTASKHPKLEETRKGSFPRAFREHGASETLISAALRYLVSAALDHSHTHLLTGRLNTVKMSFSPKLIYKFNVIPIKILECFSVEIDKPILNLYRNTKDLE